ncbi:hypothetical protein BaRGS_00028787 [Batillaria attramentaria]|uniref:Uncharacterized protein n=1 Tax=Batillaria attramentaria TaxID=370345 RepID=A0ABD0JXT6_9CAEN
MSVKDSGQKRDGTARSRKVCIRQQSRKRWQWSLWTGLGELATDKEEIYGGGGRKRQRNNLVRPRNCGRNDSGLSPWDLASQADASQTRTRSEDSRSLEMVSRPSGVRLHFVGRRLWQATPLGHLALWSSVVVRRHLNQTCAVV